MTNNDDDLDRQPENPRLWIRCRHIFRDGRTTDWEWMVRKPGTEEWIEDTMREHREAHLHDNGIDHDGYRGMEWEYDEVPDEVLTELIQKAEKAILGHKRQIAHLRRLLLPEALRPWRQDWSSNHITLERKIGETHFSLSINKYSGECKVFSGPSQTSMPLQDRFYVPVLSDEKMMLDAAEEWARRNKEAP